MAIKEKNPLNRLLVRLKKLIVREQDDFFYKETEPSEDISKKEIEVLFEQVADLKKELNAFRETVQENDNQRKTEIKNLEKIIPFEPKETVPTPEPPKPKEDDEKICSSFVPKYDIIFNNLNLTPFLENNIMNTLTDTKQWFWRIITMLLLAVAAIFIPIVELPPADSFIFKLAPGLVIWHLFFCLANRYGYLPISVRYASLIFALLICVGLTISLKALIHFGGDIAIVAWILIVISVIFYYQAIVEHFWKIHTAHLD